MARDGDVVTLRWPAVEGADYYQVWRDIMVTSGLDAEGNVVELEEPKHAAVPWGKVEPTEGIVKAQIAQLDGDETRWGVSAVQVVDGEELHSEIRYVPWPEEIGTGARPTSWGDIKRRKR